MVISSWFCGDFSACGLYVTGLMRLRTWYAVWLTIILRSAFGEVGIGAITYGCPGTFPQMETDYLACFHVETLATYMSLWEALVTRFCQRCSCSRLWRFGTIFHFAFSRGVGWSRSLSSQNWRQGGIFLPKRSV